jgi:glycine/D-amino acid oxidase-like deaminating enzyme
VVTANVRRATPANPAAAERRLNLTTSTWDVAVVGAGIIGASVAYHLARAGRRVLVLDARAAGSGATANSFSWLNAVSKEPESYHRLNAAGRDEYARLAGEIDGIEVHGGGCIAWEATPEERQRLEERVARLQDRGYDACWISRRALAEMEPALIPEPGVERIAWYRGDGWVDAPSVARALLDQVRAADGEVRETCPVTAFGTAAAGEVRLDTAAGPVLAGAVVLCAGTATITLARDLGADIPVERRPGLLAVTEPVPAGTLGRVVYAPGVHLRPDVSGGLRLGADDVDALTSEDTPPEPSSTEAQVLRRRAAAILPGVALPPVARVHIGIRPVPADGHTIAGRLPGRDNVWVAVTHSGVTLGPLLGRLLTDEITAGRRDPLLSEFGPERFV